MGKEQSRNKKATNPFTLLSFGFSKTFNGFHLHCASGKGQWVTKPPSIVHLVSRKLWYLKLWYLGNLDSMYQDQQPPLDYCWHRVATGNKRKQPSNPS